MKVERVKVTKTFEVMLRVSQINKESNDALYLIDADAIKKSIGFKVRDFHHFYDLEVKEIDADYEVEKSEEYKDGENPT